MGPWETEAAANAQTIEQLQLIIGGLLLPVAANILNALLSSQPKNPVGRFLMQWVIKPLALAYGKARAADDPDPKK